MRLGDFGIVAVEVSASLKGSVSRRRLDPAEPIYRSWALVRVGCDVVGGSASNRPWCECDVVSIILISN